MKLIKSREINKAHHLCRQSSFIDDYWFHIKDNGITIGIVTGYRISIPYLTNDILTNKDSEIEFEDVSQLCYQLWNFLDVYPEIIKGKNGYLYFLNNIHIDEKYFSFEKENNVLSLLQSKMDVIIYSCGNTEPFDPWYSEKKGKSYWIKHKSLLLNNNWYHTNDKHYYIYRNPKRQAKGYKYDSLTSIKETPFEHWFKNQGTNWAQSIWRSIIKDHRFEQHWKSLSNEPIVLLKDQFDDDIEPIHLLKHFKIIDFIQYNPNTRTANGAPSKAVYLRDEGLIIKYKKNRYQIYYSQCLINDVMFHAIDYGKFDEIEQLYVIENVRNAITISAFNIINSLFTHFFKIIFSQYQVDIQKHSNVVSLFQNEHIKRNYLF
ncbi:hypothetical protein [Bacillus toyonensis]|uniref:hypothetical protein n=1 Tax=Bacillus toyonensis TaxID=155322 RepID=UPI002E22C37E|nr:hypothetical protein [Bacillus toyonensis]